MKTMLCCAKLTQSCPALCDHIDCSLPRSSVHGILQARILEWVTLLLLQGIFPTQGSNLHLLCLLHWQAGSLPPGKSPHSVPSSFNQERMSTTGLYSNSLEFFTCNRSLGWKNQFSRSCTTKHWRSLPCAWKRLNLVSSKSPSGSHILGFLLMTHPDYGYVFCRDWDCQGNVSSWPGCSPVIQTLV